MSQLSKCEEMKSSSGVPPVSPHTTASRPTNENNISISFPPSQATGDQSTERCGEILVNPQPLKIDVGTTTDWPTVIATILVGVGSVLTTLLVGWLSHVNQRSQIRSSTANFRHGWQIELRELTAKFLAIVARIHFEMEGKPEYWRSPESNQSLSDLVETQVRIELMLDKSKDYSTKIIQQLEAIVVQLKEQNVNELTRSVNELTSQIRDVLEQAWQDIRKDLQGK